MKTAGERRMLPEGLAASNASAGAGQLTLAVAPGGSTLPGAPLGNLSGRG